MKRKRLIIILIVLIVLGVIGYIFVKNGALPVTKVEIKNRQVEKTVSASGVVKSNEEADLSFASTGRVVVLNYKEGDIVKKGQIIAVQYNVPLSQSIQASRDARDVVIRNLELFVKNREDNIDSLGGEDAYEIELRRQNELLSKAEAEYQADLATLTNTYIAAPFEGTILDITKEEGETATAGETIVKIANLNTLIFEIELEQQDLGTIKSDMPVKINLDAFEDVDFNGTITQIPLYANGSGNETFLINIQLNQTENNKVLLGMDGDAFIVLAQTDSEVPSLAFDEINYDADGKAYVFVLKNGLIERKDIETGLEGDIYTQVLTSMTDEIIKASAGKNELKPGTKAKIM